MRPALRAAFLRTGYEAGGVVVRIGRRSAAMDALLRRRGARAAGFVTAWNPFSRLMPLGWNRRLQARLRQAARGAVLEEGWGRGRSGGRGWAEHHLLVAGDARRIAVLARRFRQHAVVTVSPGRRARLRPALGRGAARP